MLLTSLVAAVLLVIIIIIICSIILLPACFLMEKDLGFLAGFYAFVWLVIIITIAIYGTMVEENSQQAETCIVFEENND